MSDADATAFTWRWNPKSQTLHRFMVSGGALLTGEGCQNDDAKHFEDISETDALELLAKGVGDPCHRCLPPDSGGSDAAGGVEETTTDTEGEVA